MTISPPSMTINPVFGTVLAKGLVALLLHTPPPHGWHSVGNELLRTYVVDQTAAKCHPRVCRAAIVTISSPVQGGTATLLSPQGNPLGCRPSFVVTGFDSDLVCVQVSGCSLDASACSSRGR